MRCDVVIVGGGAAGCVLAGRLAANPRTSVLLPEAGPDYPDPDHIPGEIKFGHTRFADGQATQRGFPEDFDSWAALGNDEWSYDKVLPFFRKSERDLDIEDNYCHRSDGPMPARRRQSGPWPAIQQAFHTACLQAGFGTTSDKNGLHPAGLGVTRRIIWTASE